MTPTDLRDRPVSRRCALLGVGGVGAAAVLAACSSGSDGASGTATTAAGTPSAETSAATSSPAAPESSAGTSSSAAAPAADAIASLADIPVGGTATVEVDGENVLLSQPTAGTVEGFSAVCPHQGGLVKPNGAAFKCSLHGSEFDIDGAVTSGPAQSDLKAFDVSVSGDSVVKA